VNGGTKQRIVVGVDGSAQSERALQWAAYLAACTGSDIEALIAWPPEYEWGRSWIPGAAGWSPADASAKALEIALEHVFGHNVPPSLRRTIVAGRPAKALIEASRGAIALVVGSRGHGALTGSLLGSVSTASAAHAPCPVVVVPGTVPAPTPSPGAVS
jgi:nucleotide-binding universal stress UspA family protein